MNNKLVPLSAGDVITLRKQWRKHSKNQLEQDIVESWLYEGRHYQVVRADNNIVNPIVKIGTLNKELNTVPIPFYYTRNMFRKVTIPPKLNHISKFKITNEQSS